MTTDLGHGRGWAADDAAASIFRIDAQLGQPVQITEAGRSAEDADKNYAAYRAYLDGGPWAPLALPAKLSVHCKGEAVDSNEHDAPWEANGWIQTARYDDDRDEPWHREYFKDRDQHLNDPTTDTTLEDLMKLHLFQIDPRSDGRWIVADFAVGEYHVVSNGTQLDLTRQDPRVTELSGPQPAFLLDGMTAR
jgi:hypothetical protein